MSGTASEVGVTGADDTLEQLAVAFGSFAGFEAQLTKAAAITRGSGRGVLACEPLSGRLIVEQVHGHQGDVGRGSVPVLVFDAWEHAFYPQNKNQKVGCTEAMWAVVNRQDVAERAPAYCC